MAVTWGREVETEARAAEARKATRRNRGKRGVVIDLAARLAKRTTLRRRTEAASDDHTRA